MKIKNILATGGRLRMKKIIVNSLEEMKNAMSVNYSLIIVDNKSAVQESIAYFKKKKVAGAMGTAGIVAGIFLAWLLLVIGVGEKILNTKSYTFLVREDMQNCIVIKKNFVKEICEREIKEIEENFHKYDLRYNKVAKELGVKSNHIRKAFTCSFKEISKYEDILKRVSDYIDNITGKEHKYLDYSQASRHILLENLSGKRH